MRESIPGSWTLHAEARVKRGYTGNTNSPSRPVAGIDCVCILTFGTHNSPFSPDKETGVEGGSIIFSGG